MDSPAKKSRRYQERRPASLKVKVRWLQSLDLSGEEETVIKDVSRSGARLTLEQEVEVGQPIHLTFAMSRLLRAYEKNEPLYHVWAIVRTVNCLQSEDTEKKSYEIGVAFIGPAPPDGYLEVPEKRYELKPAPNAQGLWQVREITGKQMW